MKKNFFAIVAAFTLVSCTDDDLSSSGNIITETRSITGFTGLNINAGRNIKLVYGTQEEITIKGSDNLVRHLRTRVNNGQLIIDYDRDQINHEDVEVTVTLPYFKELYLNGKRSLNTYGTFNYVKHIIVVSNGENDITANDEFEAENLDINVKGTGKADFKKLSCEIANATITGDATLYVKPELSLKAKIQGSGKIYYLGQPKIFSDITGSGEILSL